MRRGAVFIAALAIAALVAFLAAASIKDSVSPSALAGDVRTLTWALYRMEDGRSGMVKLPHVFNNLPPRSKVELWLNLDSNPGDSILIKTFYSELRVYADDELLFRRGDDGSYPSFLNDPPTELTMTQLPEKTRQLRLEYASPTQRGRVEAQPIFIGSDLSLYSRQFRTDIVSLIFSLLLLLFAIFVILLTFFLMTGLAEARSILWLGLLCLSGAVWGVGECDAMLFLIPYPALMYLMAFCGLYFIPIPFLMYVSSVVRPVIQWPFRAMLAVHAACLAYVLAAQAAGRADLSSFIPRFHFLILFPFAASFLIMILEHKKYATKLAARLAVSTLILAGFIVLEIINYRVRFTNMLSLFFNAGILVFSSSTWA
jgi:hypothetical protein